MSIARCCLIVTGLLTTVLSGLLVAQETSGAKATATGKKAESKSNDDPVPPPPPPPRAGQKPSVTKEAPSKSQPAAVALPNAASAHAALVKIQTAFGQNPEWDGIQITSVRFESDQDQVLLVVDGRLSEGRLRSKAQMVCDSVMQDTFAPANGVLPLPQLDQLPVLKPSQRDATKAFNEGLELYRKGSHEAAGREFARAISENPFQLSYKYWQVAAELAAGHDDQARRLLRPLVLRRSQAKSARQTDEYTEVVRRLESVQGNVRQRMSRLEEELLRETAAKKS